MPARLPAVHACICLQPAPPAARLSPPPLPRADSSDNTRPRGGGGPGGGGSGSEQYLLSGGISHASQEEFCLACFAGVDSSQSSVAADLCPGCDTLAERWGLWD